MLLALLAPDKISLEDSLQGTGFAPVASYSVRQLIYVGLELIFISAAILSFFNLLIGGLQWITSGGDKEGVEKARKKITAALVGLAITLSVYAIASIVDIIFFGGSGGLFKFTIPTLN